MWFAAVTVSMPREHKILRTDSDETETALPVETAQHRRTFKPEYMRITTILSSVFASLLPISKVIVRLRSFAANHVRKTPKTECMF